MTMPKKQHKLAINLIIALALFLNAVAPLSVVAKELSPPDNAVEEFLFGEQILICTPTGYKYISIEELNERQNDDQGELQNHCLLCQISMSAHVLYAVDLNGFPEIEYRNVANKIYSENAFQKPVSLTKVANPRAPPVFL